MSSSGTMRVGLVPCPLCHNIALHRATCKACEGAGMMAVDKAIATGLALSDTEREMHAVTKGDDDEHS